jgi:hypothetical protein
MFGTERNFFDFGKGALGISKTVLKIDLPEHVS